MPLGSGLTQGHAGRGLLPLNFPPVLLKLTLTLTQDRRGVGLWDAAGPMVRHLSLPAKAPPPALPAGGNDSQPGCSGFLLPPVEAGLPGPGLGRGE